MALKWKYALVLATGKRPIAEKRYYEKASG